MKKLLLSYSLFLIPYFLFSQNVGIGTNTPNANAILEINSSTKGILIPRTSTTTRLTIPATKGLLVYDTTTSSIWFNDGANWIEALSGNSGWGLNGNSNTNAAINFIGTTDAKSIRFRINNQWAGSIDSALDNTLLGYGAGKNNTNGFANTAFGVRALFNNTSGGNNTAIGVNALNNNTFRNNNTAIGTNALFTNNFGSENTAIGPSALFSNTTGISNTAIGFNAMLLNTGGSGNTATGVYALRVNTNGSGNTANGVQALFSNTTGQNNTAIGVNALGVNSIANNNTAVGHSSLNANSTGLNNTAIGLNTLASSTTANNNTAIGMSSLLNSTTGGNNTFIGALSGSTNTTGSSNVAIGYNAQTGTTLTNAIAIGANATVTQSNSLILGGTGADAVNVGIGLTAPFYKLSVDGTVGIYNAGNTKGYITGINNNLLINANRAGFIGGDPDNIIMQLTTGSGLTLVQAGNVGIGIDSPIHKLHILGSEAIESSGTHPFLLFRESNTDIGFVEASNDDIRIGTTSTNINGKVVVRTANTNRFWIDNAGNISIGNSFKVTNGFLVNVQGKMICEEVKVQLVNNWPDYVFKTGYSLKSFDELRNYIRTNNHLPNIPAAAELEQNGLSLGDMQKRMMEKIEELTLYVLELEKQNTEQSQRINQLEKKNKDQ